MQNVLIVSHLQDKVIGAKLNEQQGVTVGDH